jgi:endonuclease-3
MLDVLAGLYPEARTALRHEGPFQLLVATILSAQCTDRRVNEITPGLFAAFPDPEAFVAAGEETVAEAIRGCGLWRTKARNITEACRILLERYSGEVPRRREELMALPGVGRKTANVVLANAFDVPALAVDTHVLRVANRLGLAAARTPDEVERQLVSRIPRRLWAPAHHWLIWHGRAVCTARRPRCSECALVEMCPTGRRQAATAKPAAANGGAGSDGAPPTPQPPQRRARGATTPGAEESPRRGTGRSRRAVGTAAGAGSGAGAASRSVAGAGSRGATRAVSDAAARGASDAAARGASDAAARGASGSAARGASGSAARGASPRPHTPSGSAARAPSGSGARGASGSVRRTPSGFAAHTPSASAARAASGSTAPRAPRGARR